MDDLNNKQEEQQEEQEERSLDLLLKLPYSEMTEEEIERVIEYRAEIKKRDDEHAEKMQMLKDAMNEEIEIHKDMANKAQTVLDELTAHAINRFNEVSDNG